jgi:biotin transport system substrate-specific component
MTTQALTLRQAVWSRSNVLTEALLAIAGAGLVAAAAQLSFHLPGISPVPVTGQTFAVLVVGTSLGIVTGTASLILYFLVGIAGAPVYAHGDHGWAVITSASGGYIVGFILAAAFCGLCARLGWDKKFGSAIGGMLTANVIVYLVGLPWLAIVLNTNLEKTLQYGLYPFVPGDLVKLYLAGAVLPLSWKLVRRFRGVE